METLIVLCLLLVIALLLQDKIVINRKSEHKPKREKAKTNVPSIMGKTKPARSQLLITSARESQMEEVALNPDNLDIEYDANESLSIRIPQEELDEVFGTIPDLEAEEEEWNRYGTADGDIGFAQGVTFEELSAAGSLLQKEKLEPSQKETAVAIVHKLQGTELFSLLENSVAGASRKIATLLDSTLAPENETGSSNLRKNDHGDFDIGEFV